MIRGILYQLAWPKPQLASPTKTKLNLSWAKATTAFAISLSLWTRIAYLTVYTNLEPPNQNKSLTKCFPIGLGSLEPVLGPNPISPRGGGDFTPTQFYTT